MVFKIVSLRQCLLKIQNSSQIHDRTKDVFGLDTMTLSNRKNVFCGEKNVAHLNMKAQNRAWKSPQVQR